MGLLNFYLNMADCNVLQKAKKMKNSDVVKHLMDNRFAGEV